MHRRSVTDCEPEMIPTKNRVLSIVGIFCFSLIASPALSDLGNAEIPVNSRESYPETSHNALCSSINQDCVVTFKDARMSVDGSKGIERHQLIGFRTEFDRQETYFYIDYSSATGAKRTALFLFHNRKAAAYFGQALSRWYKQDPNSYPVTY